MDEETQKALDATRQAAEEFRLKAPIAATQKWGVALTALCHFQPEPGEVFYPMPNPHDKIAELYGVELNPAPHGKKAGDIGTRLWNSRYVAPDTLDPENTEKFKQDADDAADRMLEQLKQEPNQ